MSKWWANEDAGESTPNTPERQREQEWMWKPYSVSVRFIRPDGSAYYNRLGFDNEDTAISAAAKLSMGPDVDAVFVKAHGGRIVWEWMRPAGSGLREEAFGDLPPRNNGVVDEHALNDLWLFADNTSALYNQKKSIIENLTRRIKKGTYDPNLAPVLWEYWIESAAKLYAKENGGVWHKLFNKATRDELARRIAVHEYQDIVIHGGGVAAEGSEEETHAADFPHYTDAMTAAVRQGATHAVFVDSRTFFVFRPFSPGPGIPHDDYFQRARLYEHDGKWHVGVWLGKHDDSQQGGLDLPPNAEPIPGAGTPERRANREANESANVIFENDAAEEESRKAKKHITKLRWHREAPGVYFAQGNLGVYKTHRQRPNRRKDILPIVLTLDASPLKSFEKKDDARSFAQHYDEITPFISKQQNFVQPSAPTSTPEVSPMGPMGAPVDNGKGGGCLPWVKISRDPERYSACLAIAQKLGPINNARKVYDLLNDSMMREDQEVLVVILCDVQGQLRGVSEVHRGARSRVGVAISDVMRIVLASGAEMYLVCHQHPSGKASPSDADRHLTKEIQKATKLYGSELTFVDHVVLGNKQYYSIVENKLYRV